MITTEPADFITLTDVKAHLNKSGDGDNAELQGYVAAAQSMIVERIGQVSSVTAVEDLDGGTGQLLLKHRPIISITSVQTLPSLTAVSEADEPNSTAGWTLDNPEGILTHTTTFPARIRVTYQAGRDPVPGNIRLAALELVEHMWQSSQLNSSVSRPGIGGESEAPYIPGLAYGLPIKVREKLGLGVKMHSDRPLVG